MTPQEVLLKAADWLETHEWCQGRDGIKREGEIVARCAVNVMGHVSPRMSKSRAQAFRLLLGTTKVSTVVIWNDTPGRTKSEVIEAMRSAAK